MTNCFIKSKTHVLSKETLFRYVKNAHRPLKCLNVLA